MGVARALCACAILLQFTPRKVDAVAAGRVTRHACTSGRIRGHAVGLPADFTVTIHYQDSDIPNVFATLGGHVVVFRGLITRREAWAVASQSFCC